MIKIYFHRGIVFQKNYYCLVFMNMWNSFFSLHVLIHYFKSFGTLNGPILADHNDGNNAPYN